MDVKNQSSELYRRRRRHRDAAFYLLSQVSTEMMDGDKYNDLVMMVGNSDRVIDMSYMMLDGRQFYKRLGIETNGDLDELSIYDDDVDECMLNALLDLPGREEVDGAWVVNDNGVIEPGTFYLSGDIAELKKRVRRLEGGAGRIAIRSMSLVPGTAGYMLKKSGTVKNWAVREYRAGQVSREFTKSGIIKVYGPDGKTIKQSINVHSNTSRLYDANGNMSDEFGINVPIVPTT